MKWSTLFTRTSRVKPGTQFFPPRKPKGPSVSTPAAPPPASQTANPKSLAGNSENKKGPCLGPSLPFVPRQLWCKIRENQRTAEKKKQNQELLLLGVAGVVVIGGVYFLF